MALNLASLNVRGLRDSSKCARLLAELRNLCVDTAAVQETHFTRGADCRVLESDFNVFSAYGSSTSAGVSLLVGRSLYRLAVLPLPKAHRLALQRSLSRLV